MRRRITEAIDRYLLRFLKENKLEHAYDVNCGLCEDFADFIIKILGGETERLFVTWAEDLAEVKISHAMITYVNCHGRKIYFDSECPQGVDSMYELPCFLNASKTREEVLYGKVDK